MLKVSNARRKEIREFNLREWHGVDVEHYGRPVQWNEKKFLFKAEEDGEIVGTTSGKYESGVLYVYTMIVARAHRRKGIGRALMEKVYAFGKKIGAHKVHLIAGKGWSANTFYERLGFEKGGELPDHHFHHDFIIWWRLL